LLRTKTVFGSGSPIKPHDVLIPFTLGEFKEEDELEAEL